MQATENDALLIDIAARGDIDDRYGPLLLKDGENHPILSYPQPVHPFEGAEQGSGVGVLQGVLV